ncbi:YfhL family 4Fe-4S ferredoxin [Candidatus Hepatincolaceae symbiont of Richtersius coronifer]
MVLKITTDCTNCSACEPECPNNAITQGDEIFIIDPDLCTECIGAYDEAQCVAVCPADSIIKNLEINNTPEELLQKYNMIHKL